MRQLERVDLGWCSSVTDSDVKALAKLPSLRELDLSRTLVTKPENHPCAPPVPSHIRVPELRLRGACLLRTFLKHVCCEAACGIQLQAAAAPLAFSAQ